MRAWTAVRASAFTALPDLKIRRRRRARRALPVIVAFVIAWPLLAWGAARVLVVRPETIARADALVVLSGSADYVERARWAAQLFHEGRAPKIILTNDNQHGGWSSREQRNPFFVERAAIELQRAGVPADLIEILPQPISSTHDEAVLLREYADAHKLPSLLVVTSAYHSRRAWWTLRRVFDKSSTRIGIDPVAIAQQPKQSLSPLTWWWTLRGWHSIALEYPKLVYYFVRYN